MNLDRVTMTGADDSIKPEALVEISAVYPFVEWGLLLSEKSGGTARFPSLKWLAKLHDTCNEFPGMRISLHVCGRWVREICAGNWTPLFTNIGPVLDCGQRVQLNFHADQHLLGPQFLAAAESRCAENRWQVIFQCDGVNDELVLIVRDAGVDAVPLYDKSRGAGVVPDEWPQAMPGVYSGYAGGHGPDNLADELKSIAKAAGEERIWIDMETKVRSDNDQQFDLAKVVACLEIAAPLIRRPK